MYSPFAQKVLYNPEYKLIQKDLLNQEKIRKKSFVNPDINSQPLEILIEHKLDSYYKRSQAASSKNRHFTALHIMYKGLCYAKNYASKQQQACFWVHFAIAYANYDAKLTYPGIPKTFCINALFLGKTIVDQPDILYKLKKFLTATEISTEYDESHFKKNIANTAMVLLHGDSSELFATCREFALAAWHAKVAFFLNMRDTYTHNLLNKTFKKMHASIDDTIDSLEFMFNPIYPAQMIKTILLHFHSDPILLSKAAYLACVHRDKKMAHQIFSKIPSNTPEGSYMVIVKGYLNFRIDCPFHTQFLVNSIKPMIRFPAHDNMISKHLYMIMGWKHFMAACNLILFIQANFNKSKINITFQNIRLLINKDFDKHNGGLTKSVFDFIFCWHSYRQAGGCSKKEGFKATWQQMCTKSQLTLWNYFLSHRNNLAAIPIPIIHKKIIQHMILPSPSTDNIKPQPSSLIQFYRHAIYQHCNTKHHRSLRWADTTKYNK